MAHNREATHVLLAKFIAAYVILWLIGRLILWAALGFRGPPLGRMQTSLDIEREIDKIRKAKDHPTRGP